LTDGAGHLLVQHRPLRLRAMPRQHPFFGQDRGRNPQPLLRDQRGGDLIGADALLGRSRIDTAGLWIRRQHHIGAGQIIAVHKGPAGPGVAPNTGRTARAQGGEIAAEGAACLIIDHAGMHNNRIECGAVRDLRDRVRGPLETRDGRQGAGLMRHRTARASKEPDPARIDQPDGWPSVLG